MNTELFIAKRLIKGGAGAYSGQIIRIAIVSVALGLAVMIVSVAIVTGFQREIKEKISGFGSHIQIAKFDSNNSFEFSAVTKDQSFYKALANTKGVRHIQAFATKAGIIKTEEQIQGVIFKGVDTDFDWSFFKDKLVSGSVSSSKDSMISNQVIISKNIADLLKIKLGDPLRMYFIIENQPRARRFTVSGIYNTGLGEFDMKFIFGDIRHIQKLNGWNHQMVSGFDVFIEDFDKLDKMGKIVYNTIGYDMNSKTIRELYPQIFDWLELQDVNEIIILVLMILVSGMAMISTLLILILERTNMIGILKALGISNSSVRRIFLIQAAYIIGKGMLIGNVVGISLCLIQKFYGVVPLPQESYFMSVVPINLDVLALLLINVGTLATTTFILVIPSLIITRISAVKAIRFD